MTPAVKNPRPTFFENHMTGEVVCGSCRAKMLADPLGIAQGGVTDAEPVRRQDFENIGRAPWAGNDEGMRYMQCDRCNEQFGPDA